MWSEGSKYESHEKKPGMSATREPHTVYLPRDFHPHLYQLEGVQLRREIPHETVVHIDLVRLRERVIEEFDELQRDLVP
jgi:hypothetical protein